MNSRTIRSLLIILLLLHSMPLCLSAQGPDGPIRPECHATNLTLGLLTGNRTYDAMTDTFGYTGAANYSFTCTNGEYSLCAICINDKLTYQFGPDTYPVEARRISRQGDCGYTYSAQINTTWTGIERSFGVDRTYRVTIGISPAGECDESRLTTYQEFVVPRPG
jgi:hypothetical protein